MPIVKSEGSCTVGNPILPGGLAGSKATAARRLPTSAESSSWGENDDWRLLTSYLFEDAGYTAYAAGDGRQAVTLVARLLPDVVVVQMDAPDGLDVLMRLREDARAADIPVVVLTAWIESAHAQRVRALGGVPLAPDATDIKALVGEVDALIVVARARAARAQTPPPRPAGARAVLQPGR